MSELISNPKALEVNFETGNGQFAQLVIHPKGSKERAGFNDSYFAVAAYCSELVGELGILPPESKASVSFTDSSLNLTSNRKLRKSIVKCIHEECENAIVAEAIIAIIHLHL